MIRPSYWQLELITQSSKSSLWSKVVSRPLAGWQSSRQVVRQKSLKVVMREDQPRWEDGVDIHRRERVTWCLRSSRYDHSTFQHTSAFPCSLGHVPVRRSGMFGDLSAILQRRGVQCSCIPVYSMGRGWRIRVLSKFRRVQGRRVR